MNDDMDEEEHASLLLHPDYPLKPQEDLYMISGLTNYCKALTTEDGSIPDKLVKKIRKDAKDLHRKMVDHNYHELLGMDSKLPDERSNLVQLLKYKTNQQSHELLQKYEGNR